MNNDEKYLQLLLNRLAVCKRYKPKFGQGGGGLAYEQFRELYATDPFYAWFGLDNPFMYAAHKAAGGITSVYRQIGMGVEELFREILQDHLNLSSEQVNWSYAVKSSTGRERTLSLDARLNPDHVTDIARQQVIRTWLGKASAYLELDDHVARAMRGAVFEVRQGYKSKDSKRQNADIANAAEAYTQGYLPILVVLSTQIDLDIIERYERGKWLVLRGILNGTDTTSTYAFVLDVIGYDLAAFFQQHAITLKNFTQEVLESLLSADD